MNCRSCSWLDRDYRTQLLLKERKVRDELAFLEPFELQESVGSPSQGFRNRAKMAVTGTVARPVVGLTGEQELDDGRELLDCPIHHPRLNELMAAMPGILRSHAIEPYRIRERKGELKGLIAYFSPESCEMYLRFVLRSRRCLGQVTQIVPELQREFPGLVCVSANIQPIPHAILEGPDEIILSERKTLAHRIGGLTVQLAPQAFVQTNFQVSKELYAVAAAWISEAKPAKMLELYCGQGLFSFFAREAAAEVQGFEINAEAVRAANATASELGFANLVFKAMNAEKVSAEIAEFAPDLILANPPRKGLGDGVNSILEYRPEHLLYSSCSIETLAADLRKMAPVFQLKRLRVFDMFPHTPHFEILVWLTRSQT